MNPPIQILRNCLPESWAIFFFLPVLGGNLRTRKGNIDPVSLSFTGLQLFQFSILVLSDAAS